MDYSAAIRRLRARSIIGPAMAAADPIVRLTLDFIMGSEWRCHVRGVYNPTPQRFIHGADTRITGHSPTRRVGLEEIS